MLGAVLSNVTFAEQTQAPSRKNSRLTKFDRIIYWKNARRCDYDEENMNLPAGDLPSCYNAIPQEYALGFINNVKSIDRAKRDITINSNHKGNGKGTATFYPGKSAGDLTGERSPLKYFDLYDGASYMGDLYDFRVYAYGNARARDVNNSLVEHWHSGGNYVASEWHFYPRNTLKKLDQLYYSPEEDIIESGIGDPKDSCTTVNVDHYKFMVLFLF